MADLGSKSALKISIDNKVFTNTNYEVSAEDIRSSFEDTIDTLKLGIVTMASYADLKTLVTNSRLEPGMWYSFPYETKHVVVGPGILNTASTGYTPITETLMIQAKTTSTFFHQAKSLDYPSDDILYDFTLATALVANDRSGLIYWRRDNVRGIEAWFDVRNQVVARYPLNLTSVSYTAPGTINRGDIIDDTADSLLKICLQDGITDSTNFRMVEDISIINHSYYSYGDSIIAFGNSIPVNSASPNYHQSFEGTCANIVLAYGAYDVYFYDSSSITLDRDTVARLSFISSLAISVGTAVGRIVLVGCNQIDIDDTGYKLYVYNSARIKFAQNARSAIIINCDDTVVGSTVWDLYLKDSNSNEVKANSTSIMMNRGANSNIINQSCSGITLGNSVSNVFDPGCSDIQIFSGGENKFGAGCDTINLLGELDSAFTGGGYYSPYSVMLRNSFGVGCSNITFNSLGGRGNQFGDECRNLLFTSAGLDYRVIGCSFARGIQNKTFEDIVHGCSFITPCQVTATITSADWYAQAIWLNADDSVGAVKERTWQENNASSSGNLMIGYQQAGTTFFGSTAKNSDGTTASGFRIYGNVPTGHAFIWTTDGYPLSSTLTAGLGKSADPTDSLNR
jgi:hypothetical protein